MSESCCAVTPESATILLCPKSNSAGRPVDWTTVAALTSGRVPPQQDFRLCRDPECEVVYFGSKEAVLAADDLNVVPGFKNGSDGIVCHCFLYRESDIERQLGESGTTDILESIKYEVQAGNCACEVRNPSGKCCLGEVQKTIQSLEKELVMAS